MSIQRIKKNFGRRCEGWRNHIIRTKEELKKIDSPLLKRKSDSYPCSFFLNLKKKFPFRKKIVMFVLIVLIFQ